MKLCIFCGKENEDASRYCCCCGMEIQDEELQNSIAQQTSLGVKPVTVQKGSNRKKLFVGFGALLLIGIVVLVINLCLRYGYTHGECGAYGDNLVWEFDDGVLTISGEGEMRDYSSHWGHLRNEIRLVEIKTGVTSIGRNAFADFLQLERIGIPNTVTHIGENAFSWCRNLESIELPSGMSEIAEGTFRFNKSLKNIVVPDSVTVIGDDAFYECDSLESVILPNRMENIGQRAFFGCNDLRKIQIPEGVSTIEVETFQRCSRLKEIKFPESLNEIQENAFDHAGLEELEIPAGTEVIGKFAFSYCSSLKEITFLGVAPNWESSRSERMLSCFNGVTATVYYPEWNETWDNYYGTDLGGNLTFVPYS